MEIELDGEELGSEFSDALVTGMHAVIDFLTASVAQTVLIAVGVAFTVWALARIRRLGEFR